MSAVGTTRPPLRVEERGTHVLATLDRTIPSIRTVNVGGEACPQELVERWGGAGRRILNTYGPTEATVTCTWAELVPGKPVTIEAA